MLPAINRSAGMSLGFPDVCMTPAGLAVVPIPYPNIAMHGAAIGFSPNVMLSHVPALNLASMIPVTMGDEGGVAHPMIKQMGRFTTGSPVVFVNLLPGIHLTCLTTGNNMNNALGAVLAPGITNVYYTYSGLDEGVEPAPDLAATDRPAGPSVELVRFEDGEMEVRIHVLGADVPSRVYSLVQSRGEGQIRRMVLDLRDNPGGDLTAFLELAGDFLPPGSELATHVDPDGDEVLHRSTCEEPYSFPVHLLVNRRTASAAELFAGCLVSHRRATVEGGPTYGKTTVSRVQMGPGGALSSVPCGHVVLSGGGPHAAR